MTEADNITAENHREQHLPRVTWAGLGTNARNWTWPFSKVGYEHPEVLFTSLHTKFNCIPVAIQDPHAWHADVCELALASKTKEQFEAALRKRQDERFQEICETWELTKESLTADPRLWESPQIDRANQWGSFIRLARHFSFDCLLGHFANYLPEHHMPAQPTIETAVQTPHGAQQPQQPQQPQEPQEPQRPEPSRHPDQRAPDSPPPSPAPASVPNAKRKRATRASRGPTQRSRIEKPSPKQRATRSNAQGSVRRSARLQQRK
ncbi:hypothetical protein O1611_g2559 [Lasiodiplodia mahajangana]|uniref:Uncharacterized protein n=1 Tax=Lasiodiplodia mahajangana TaxID=1108764 RepID=A0ACC2JUB7_9PEZI|nr:hypothetical protein O1611_g2559 [Lasiodiplodia mahajangana]